MVKRFEVYLIGLDPTIGSEVKKTRPAIIVSPDEMNQHLQTVIIAPLTKTLKKYPTRVSTQFQKQTGEIMLDQIRTVDKRRLVKKLGTIDSKTQSQVCQTLIDMFVL